MKELINNARPYANKLIASFSALFAIGLFLVYLTFFEAFGDGRSAYVTPFVIFFTCVFFAVILWIVFAIGQDNRKVPKHRRPTWSRKPHHDNTTTGAPV